MFEKHLIVMPEQAFETKEKVLHYLTHLENDRVKDADGYEKDVLEREATFPTYTIDGIAIPHAKTDSVLEPFVMYARLKAPVHWGEEDGEDARQVFLLGVPKTGKDGQSANLHLKILTHLSKKLMHDDFRSGLLNAESVDEIYQQLKKLEEDLNV